MNVQYYKTESNVDLQVTCKLMADSEEFAEKRTKDSLEHAIGKGLKEQFGSELSEVEIDIDISVRRAGDD